MSQTQGGVALTFTDDGSWKRFWRGQPFASGWDIPLQLPSIPQMEPVALEKPSQRKLLHTQLSCDRTCITFSPIHTTNGVHTAHNCVLTVHAVAVRLQPSICFYNMHSH
jgi:hypothetical protein